MYKIVHLIDGFAGAITLGSVLGFLPPVAALLSIVWILIQIYDRVRYGPRR
jgi:hypothetical protein